MKFLYDRYLFNIITANSTGALKTANNDTSGYASHCVIKTVCNVTSYFFYLCHIFLLFIFDQVLWAPWREEAQLFIFSHLSTWYSNYDILTNYWHFREKRLPLTYHFACNEKRAVSCRRNIVSNLGHTDTKSNWMRGTLTAHNFMLMALTAHCCSMDDLKIMLMFKTTCKIFKFIIASLPPKYEVELQKDHLPKRRKRLGTS